MPLMSNYWNINFSDISIDDNKKLGQGAFADCYFGKLWGKPVAIKVRISHLVENFL